MNSSSVSTTFLDTSRIGVMSLNQSSILSAANETLSTLPGGQAVIRKANVITILESIYAHFHDQKLTTSTAVEVRTRLHITLCSLPFLQHHPREREQIEEAMIHAIFKQSFYPACVPDEILQTKAFADEPHAAFVRVQVNETFSPRSDAGPPPPPPARPLPPSSSSSCCSCWKALQAMLVLYLPCCCVCPQSNSH